MEVSDRVALKLEPKRQGVVVRMLSESRAVVQWDDGSLPEQWNAGMLKLLPKPAISTYCSYCLENFRLRPGTTKATEDIVSNSRNGSSFHLSCAKAIAETVALWMKKQGELELPERKFIPDKKAPFIK